MKGRAIAEPTQISAQDDHDDDRQNGKNPSTFVKHKATELHTTSTAASSPATVATRVAEASSRCPVSFERHPQHVPLHNSIDQFHDRKKIVERRDLHRDTYAVAAGASATATASSISGRRTAPEVTAFPKPWTLISTLGAKSATVYARKGHGIHNESRLRAPNLGMLRTSVKRESSSTCGVNPGSGGGVRRWNLLNTETKAVKAFRRELKSAAAEAAAKPQAGRRRWGGLKALRNTTSTLIHALNAGSRYSDEETSSNPSEDEGEEHGDDRSRRRGRRGVGESERAGRSGSENSSSIWRESSDSHFNSSSDNRSFDEEVGESAGGRVDEGVQSSCFSQNEGI